MSMARKTYFLDLNETEKTKLKYFNANDHTHAQEISQYLLQVAVAYNNINQNTLSRIFIK